MPAENDNGEAQYIGTFTVATLKAALGQVQDKYLDELCVNGAGHPESLRWLRQCELIEAAIITKERANDDA